MEIKEVKDEAGAVVSWVVLVGDLKFPCSTPQEAEHLERLLLAEKNREILGFLQGQEWEEDILEALQKQHLIFRAMILALLGAEVRIWGAGMATQLVWAAVDFCQGLHNAVHKPQPRQTPPAPGM